MKNIYLPVICVILFLSSCSSAYKTAQTPDDVYYSPGSQKQVAAAGSDEYYNANADDQYLMMKAQNANRWSYFDDYSYDNFYSPYYSPFGMYSAYNFGYSPFGFYSGFGFSPFMSFGFGGGYLSNYYLWNGMYNPYYGGVIVVTKYPTYNYYSQLHPFALTSYTGTAINNSNSFRTNSNGVRTNSFSNNNINRYSNRSFYNNSNNSNRFNTNNNFFRSQSSQPGRSFSPSSFGGGGGGGGSHSFGRVGR